MAEEKEQPTAVKIHLKTNIKQGQENENYELVLHGSYVAKKDKAYLKYDEELEGKTIHTIVKLGNEQALILRSGGVKMRLAFQCGERLNSSYESEHGTFLLQTNTKAIQHREESGTSVGGTFKVEYDLFMQGALTGSYTMTIQYKEENNSL